MSRVHRCAWAVLAAAGLFCSVSAARAVEGKLLPGNTEIVFSINIKQILGSEVFKAQKEAIDQAKAAVKAQIPPDAQKYLEKVGLDPFKDIDSITVTHPGTKNDNDSIVIIVEGTFSKEKFEATAEEVAKANGEVLKLTKVGGTRVYEVSPPGEKKFFVGLLGGKAVVATPNQELLTEIVGRAAGTAKGALKREISDLLKTTNDKQSLSIVITGAALARQAENAPIPNAQAVGPVLAAIDGISGAVTIAKNINFQLAIGSKDAATAKTLVSSGNAGILGLRILAAQKAKENEQLAPLIEVVNSLRVSASGTNTVLTGEISYENLEKLLKNIKQLQPQP